MGSELITRINPEHRRRLAWLKGHESEVSVISWPLTGALVLDVMNDSAAYITETYHILSAYFHANSVTCTVKASGLCPAVGSGLVEMPVETGAAIPLRGEIAVTRKTDLMELVQEAQFRAAAAAAGCPIAKPVPDDGMDWVVFHRNADHLVAPQVSIEVQLRSTSRIAPPLGDKFAFALDNDTFDRLTEPTIFPRVLIVCILPPDIEDWVRADRVEDIFQLRHLSYWYSPRGVTKTGRTQTTVHIPTSQVFDDVALCDIMQRVGKGEDL
jgi:hypothetical protein